MINSNTQLQTCDDGSQPVGDVEWISCLFSGVDPTWSDYTAWEYVEDEQSCLDASYAYYGPMDLNGDEAVDNCEMAEKCYSDRLGALQDEGGDVSTIVASGEAWGEEEEGMTAVTWDEECWEWFGGDATVTRAEVEGWCTDLYPSE